MSCQALCKGWTLFLFKEIWSYSLILQNLIIPHSSTRIPQEPSVISSCALANHLPPSSLAFSETLVPPIVPSLVPQELLPKQAKTSPSCCRPTGAHLVSTASPLNRTNSPGEVCHSRAIPLQEVRMAHFENIGQKNKNIYCFLAILAMKQRFSLR